MSRFNDEEKELMKDLLIADEVDEAEEVVFESRHNNTADARRRLENLLEERRLQNELEDFGDY